MNKIPSKELASASLNVQKAVGKKISIPSNSPYYSVKKLQTDKVLVAKLHKPISKLL